MNGAMHKLLFERETQYEAMACRASQIEYLECGITNRKSIHNSQQHATFSQVLF